MGTSELPEVTTTLHDEARAHSARRAARTLCGGTGHVLRQTAIALLAGCTDTSILRPAGPVGEQNRLILLNALAIMMVIVVPTIVATLVFAWWFRAGNRRARRRPDWRKKRARGRPDPGHDIQAQGPCPSSTCIPIANTRFSTVPTGSPSSWGMCASSAWTALR